jgi:hypothetical protein
VARCETRKALRKGRFFCEVKLRGLRQNQDCGIGSRRKPASVEALKAHRRMTREQAVSCGQNWARCGKPVAIGDVLRLPSARFCSETVSMEAPEQHARAIVRASVEIRTPVQSLAVHSSATRRSGDASFDVKSYIAEST